MGVFNTAIYGKMHGAPIILLSSVYILNAKKPAPGKGIKIYEKN